jgi:hypothetical protein
MLIQRYALGIGFSNQFLDFSFLFGFAQLYELGSSSGKCGSNMKAMKENQKML